MAAAHTDAQADGPQAAVPGELDLPPPLEPVPSEEDSDSSGNSADEDSDAEETAQTSGDQTDKGASINRASHGTGQAEPAVAPSTSTPFDAQGTGKKHVEQEEKQPAADINHAAKQAAFVATMAAQLAASVAAKVRSMPEAISSRVQAELEATEREMVALKDEAGALGAKFPITEPMPPDFIEKQKALAADLRKRLDGARRDIERTMSRMDDLARAAKQKEIEQRKAEEEVRKQQERELERQRLLKHLQEEDEKKRVLQQQAGLGGGLADELKEPIARCALRGYPLLASKCDACDSGFSIYGEDKHMKLTCSEGCTLHYHFPSCFRAFERLHKDEHPKFALKVPEEHACPTDACSGYITSAEVIPKDSKHDKFVFHKPKPGPVHVEPAPAQKRRRAAKPADGKPAAKHKRDASPPQRQPSPVRPVEPAPEPVREPSPPKLAAPPVNLDAIHLEQLQKAGGSKDSTDEKYHLAEAGKGKKKLKERPVKEKPGKRLDLKDLVQHAVLPDEEPPRPAAALSPEPSARDVHAQDDLLFPGPPSQQQPAPRDAGNRFADLFQAQAGGEEDEEDDIPDMDMSDFPALAREAESTGVLEAWHLVHNMKANEVTRYLLVEDIPVQGLEQDKKADAQEEIKSMLAFYSGPSFKPNDLILLRNLSCAFMRYMSPEQAERAYNDLNQNVMLAQHSALTTHYLRAWPDTSITQRLRTLIDEIPHKKKGQVEKKPAAQQQAPGIAAAAPSGPSPAPDLAEGPDKGKAKQAVPESAAELEFAHVGAGTPFGGAAAQGGKAAAAAVAKPAAENGKPQTGTGHHSALRPPGFNPQAREFTPRSASQTSLTSQEGGAPQTLAQNGTLSRELSAQDSRKLDQDDAQSQADSEHAAPDAAATVKMPAKVDLGPRTESAAPDTDKDSNASSSLGAAQRKPINPAHKNAGSLLAKLFPAKPKSPPPEPAAPAQQQQQQPQQQQPPPERQESSSKLAPPATILNFTVPVASSFKTMINKFDQTEVVGCNADSLATYQSSEQFGIDIKALTDGQLIARVPTALVMYAVDGHKLHGLWEAIPGLKDTSDGSQMVVFKRSQTFQPLPQFTCAALLNPGTRFDFELPQMLEFRETERLLNAFNAHARELEQAAAATAAAEPKEIPKPLSVAKEQPPAAAPKQQQQQHQQLPPPEVESRQADLQASIDWTARLEAQFAAKRAQEQEDAKLAAQMQDDFNTELAESKAAKAAAAEPEAAPPPSLHPTPVTPPQQQPVRPAAAPAPVPASVPVPVSAVTPPEPAPAAPALSFASFFPGARPAAAAKPPIPPPPSAAGTAAAAAAAAAVRRVRPPAYNPFAPVPRPKPAPSPVPIAQGKPAAAAATPGVMQAASAGNKCLVCGLRQSDYISLTCRHWGPCVDCLPDATKIEQFYPKCMTCQQPTQHLQRVFLNH